MKSDSDNPLPHVIATAWGLRERPGRGPRPGLSVTRIVEAAMRVADTEGLSAVSMNRVARELGAATMALYRYVGSKDELLTLMIDAAAGDPPDAADPRHGWRAGLTQWAWAERETLYRHSWVLQAPIQAPPATPRQLTWLEKGLRCLTGTGLTEGEKLSVMLLITGYVRNDVTLNSQLAAANAATGNTAEDAMSAYGQLLAKVIEPQRFPALHAVLKAGVLSRADNPDDEFRFGLDRILDGIESLVRSRA